MNTPKKEDIAPRVLALVQAQKTLQNEGITTNVVDSRINNRVAEILATHPEIAEVIEEFHARAELAAKVPEAVESKIPAEVMQKLHGTELAIVKMFLTLGPNGETVPTKDLYELVHGKDTYDPKGPFMSRSRFRGVMTATKNAITSWAEIGGGYSTGYWLKIDAK